MLNIPRVPFLASWLLFAASMLCTIVVARSDRAILHSTLQKAYLIASERSACCGPNNCACYGENITQQECEALGGKSYHPDFDCGACTPVGGDGCPFCELSIYPQCGGACELGYVCEDFPDLNCPTCYGLCACVPRSSSSSSQSSCAPSGTGGCPDGYSCSLVQNTDCSCAALTCPGGGQTCCNETSGSCTAGTCGSGFCYRPAMCNFSSSSSSSEESSRSSVQSSSPSSSLSSPSSSSSSSSSFPPSSPSSSSSSSSTSSSSSSKASSSSSSSSSRSSSSALSSVSSAPLSVSSSSLSSVSSSSVSSAGASSSSSITVNCVYGEYGTCSDGDICTGDWCGAEGVCHHEDVDVPCTVGGACVDNVCPDPSLCTGGMGCCTNNNDCNYMDEPPDDVLTCGLKGFCDNGTCTKMPNCDVSLDGNCCADLGLPVLFHDALEGSTQGEQHGGILLGNGYQPAGGYIRYDTAGRINPSHGAVCVTVKQLNALQAVTGSLLTADDGVHDGFALWAIHLPGAPARESRLSFAKMENDVSSTLVAGKDFSLSDEHTITAFWGPTGKKLLFGRDIVAQNSLAAGGAVGPSLYLGNAFGSRNGASNIRMRDVYTCGTAVSVLVSSRSSSVASSSSAPSSASSVVSSSTSSASSVPSVSSVSSSSSSRFVESCGDGILSSGEECEATVYCSAGYVCMSCRCVLLISSAPSHVCGNGNRETGEGCDDGNLQNGDGCSIACQIEHISAPVCGDGYADPSEECDDGNVRNGDGCSFLCRFESLQGCGNGVMEGDEECDDGNREEGDGCSAQCQWEGTVVAGDAVCGNGVIESLEACDDGIFNGYPGNPCGADCTYVVVRCTDQAQCLAGYVCIDGQCTTCTADHQCPTNLCRDGLCSACVADDECASRLCRNGVCVPCVIDGDCAPGQFCRNGSCLPCGENNQCATGVCGLGQCVPCSSGDECWTHLCLAGVCSACLSDAQCAAHQFCRAGSCVEALWTLQSRVSSSSSEVPILIHGTPTPPPVVARSSAFSASVAASSSPAVIRHVIPFPASLVLPPVVQTVPLPLSPQGPAGQTGPASLGIMAAGAAAGMAWIRRKNSR